MRKKPYPKNSDIEDAILYIAANKVFIHPDDFFFEIIKFLEKNGFFTGLVTAKRVWKIYEQMVKKGKIYDFLMVMRRDK